MAPLRENSTLECSGNWGPGGAKLSQDRRGAHKIMYVSFSRGGRKCGFSPYPPTRKRPCGDIIGFGPINEKTTFPSGWEINKCNLNRVIAGSAGPILRFFRQMPVLCTTLSRVSFSHMNTVLTYFNTLGRRERGDSESYINID